MDKVMKKGTNRVLRQPAEQESQEDKNPRNNPQGNQEAENPWNNLLEVKAAHPQVK